MNQGHLFIFSAPSGSGKTTIVKALIQRQPWLLFSVSATTRPKRKGEKNGVDYHFLTQEIFQEKIKNNEFAEWEEVYPGRFYGTLKSEIEEIFAKGKSVIIDIDVLGGLNLKKLYGSKSLSIFISPPDILTLSERLNRRGTETPEDLKKRIDKAKHELEFADRFDQIIVNDKLDVAIEQAENLVLNFAQ